MKHTNLTSKVPALGTGCFRRRTPVDNGIVKRICNKKGSLIYVGIKPDYTANVLYVDRKPAPNTDTTYSKLIGPFVTLRGAEYMATFRGVNPLLQTVSQAESASAHTPLGLGKRSFAHVPTLASMVNLDGSQLLGIRPQTLQEVLDTVKVDRVRKKVRNRRKTFQNR